MGTKRTGAPTPGSNGRPAGAKSAPGRFALARVRLTAEGLDALRWYEDQARDRAQAELLHLTDGLGRG